MDLSTFIWSVLAGIVATALIGTATYKIINRNKNLNKINQEGNNNNAYMNSTININYEKGERNDKQKDRNHKSKGQS
ncbi:MULTISPECIES: hypothetical protein [unclassified Aeribacillus]|uniref:hypothetical protein n=1 Tax=unclassified Aeribacillus TaxID=2640495 RepID=UPI0030F51960